MKLVVCKQCGLVYDLEHIHRYHLIVSEDNVPKRFQCRVCNTYTMLGESEDEKKNTN